MPGPDRAEPDPRIVMLRRMIGGIEDGTMGRDTVLDLVDATGIEALLHTAREQTGAAPDTTRVIGVHTYGFGSRRSGRSRLPLLRWWVPNGPATA